MTSLWSVCYIFLLKLSGKPTPQNILARFLQSLGSAKEAVTLSAAQT